MILLVAGVELWNEHRAKKAIGALSRLAEPTAAVRRGGQTREVPVGQVVPGYLVVLQAGRLAPADARRERASTRCRTCCARSTCARLRKRKRQQPGSGGSPGFSSS